MRMPSAPIADRLNEAIVHHNAGRLDRAEAIYQKLALTAPRNATVFYLWGQVAEQKGRFNEAIRHYLHALRVEPAAVSVAIRLVSLLVATGQLPEAENVARRTTQTAPKHAEAWNTLGFVAKVRGRIAESVQHHQRAVELDPTFVTGWCHLGLALGTAGRNHLALQQFDRALKLDPANVLARYGRAQALHKLYRLEEAIGEYDAVLEAQPQHHEARSYRLFALQNSDRISREQLFAEHVAYGRAVGVDGPRVELPPREGKPKLRVAILSPDLRTHSCAYFLEPLLRFLDPQRFELYLYHDHFYEDLVSTRLRKLATCWRNFVGQPLATVEQVIRSDEPDILIDLSGHVAGTVRLPIFARRIAPVQITYLGYPDTTGLSTMDFRFTDGVVDPAGSADSFAVEQLVRFSRCAWAYQPPAEAPAVAVPPSRARGAITFGCFNSPIKFTDSLFRSWASILAQVPNARLVLKGRDFDQREVREHMFGRMAAAGIPMDRVELLQRTVGTAEHLAQYADIDIALDSFPYNGTTTTCEALWMGRPVVTHSGERHASRVGASLLEAVGHSEWVAHSAEDYVRVAVELAHAPLTIESAAATLRDDMSRSVLLDHCGQSQRFAEALQRCWETVVGAGIHRIESHAVSAAA